MMLFRTWNTALAASFDDWARTYNVDVAPKLVRRGYGYPQLASVVIEHIVGSHANHANPMKWLELGVGTGMLGVELRANLPAGARLYGLDISTEMIWRAEKTGAYNDIFQGTAECLPLDSQTCNAVVSAFMIHSVLRRGLALSEMYRVLKPGGRVALIDLYRTTRRWPLISHLLDNVLSARYEYGAPSRYLSIREMAVALRRAGFVIETEVLLDADAAVARKKIGKRMHGLVVARK